MEILVVDNGRGMSVEKLASLREKLSQRNFEHELSYSEQRQSIGIINVHERFVLYIRGSLLYQFRFSRTRRCLLSYYKFKMNRKGENV